MRQLSGLSAHSMAALAEIDPTYFAALTEVYSYRVANYTAQAAFSSIDPYQRYEGREVVFNRWSSPHWDESDPHFGWTCISYFGDFVEAWLEFPQLNLRVRHRPGDQIWFRGRNLLHLAGQWGEGNRHFVVQFTHDSMWKQAGIKCISGKAPHNPRRLVIRLPPSS